MSTDLASAPTVLQLCFSKSWGGLEMYPSQLAAALSRHGCQVHAAAIEGTRVADSFKQAAIPLMAYGSLNRALFSVRGLLRYIRQHKITVLHAHKSGDMRLAALLLQLAPDLKLFFTDHMGVSLSKKDWFHRWMYRKVTRLFSISQAAHALNLKAFPLPPERITPLYNGIDLAHYQVLPTAAQRQQARLDMGLPAHGVLIGIPGRINPGKGQMQWVEALATLAHMQLDENWHGVVIGQASDRDASPGGYKDQLITRVLALGLNERISFVGFRADMARCLQALDIATIPSAYESFGLSVVESMAAGCAVIGANSGAIPELIHDDVGVLVDPNDSEAFAASLAQLIQDPGRRDELGQRAHCYVLDRFGMDAYVDKLLQYYREP